MIRSKRAFRLSLTETIGLVLVALIIVFTLGFWTKLYGIFYGSELDEYSEASFNRLTTKVQEMVSNPDENINEVTLVYYIKNGLSLRGFSAEENVIRDTCLSNEDFHKPSLCGASKGCFCICDEEETVCKDDFRCVAIDGVTKISGYNVDYNLGDARSGTTGTNYLIIYGDCDGGGGGPFQTRTLKVTRIKDREDPDKYELVVEASPLE